ncbi:hypothetical protein PRIPAC_76953 [Pristionchus pacificus]|uniref:Uncharacterized protein n=1 Tax=Pristionchus pacificus TaxID=54126 RepID=A0A2A6CPR0_PRIPA|nr:hypothetical protein PRIPAC_76953 [Pristionchus pacificus]|eukprot:PDM80195.1 hypothetical protein PRIPAC_32774 [Pristionchus pacificus]
MRHITHASQRKVDYYADFQTQIFTFFEFSVSRSNFRPTKLGRVGKTRCLGRRFAHFGREHCHSTTGLMGSFNRHGTLQSSWDLSNVMGPFIAYASQYTVVTNTLRKR